MIFKGFCIGPVSKNLWDDFDVLLLSLYFRNILLNYAVYNPSIGYTQGMSDLVAPVLATLHDEVDSFWCFVGLMEASMFATSPTDDSMDRSLVSYSWLGFTCRLKADLQ